MKIQRFINLIVMTALLALTPAQARVANNVYIMPSSGSPSVPTWGKVNLASDNAITNYSAGACYATSSSSGLLFGSLATTYGGLGGNFSSSTGALSISSGTVSAGTLNTTNGGTGLSAPSANSVLLTNGSSAYQTVAPGTSGNVLKSNGTTWQSGTLSSTFTAVTIQKFLASGGAANYQFTVTSANATVGATYTNNSQTCTVLTTIVASTTLNMSCTGSPLASGTLTKSAGTGDSTIAFSAWLNIYITPTSPAPIYIRVRMAGGGGGGGSGSVGGGTSTFGTSLLSCTGGGASSGASGGTGGTCTINSPAVGFTIPGGHGGRGAQNTQDLGGMGGSTMFGGGSGDGSAAATNSGGGGGGGTSGAFGGGGGAGSLDVIIPSPSATYTYAIGAGGTSGQGAGAAGIIVVEEHYQ